MNSVDREKHYFDKHPLKTITVAWDEATGQETTFSLWKNTVNSNDLITRSLYKGGVFLHTEYPSTIFMNEQTLRGHAKRIAQGVCSANPNDKDGVRNEIKRLRLYLGEFPSLFRRAYTDKRRRELIGFNSGLTPSMISSDSWFEEVKALLDQTASITAHKQVDVIEQNLAYMNQLLRLNTFYTSLEYERLNAGANGDSI